MNNKKIIQILKAANINKFLSQWSNKSDYFSARYLALYEIPHMWAGEKYVNLLEVKDDGEHYKQEEASYSGKIIIETLFVVFLRIGIVDCVNIDPASIKNNKFFDGDKGYSKVKLQPVYKYTRYLNGYCYIHQDDLKEKDLLLYKRTKNVIQNTNENVLIYYFKLLNRR